MKLRILPPPDARKGLRAFAGVLAGLVVTTSVADAGGILRVDDDSTAMNPGGSNWTTDAYKYLEDALADANPTDEIWVADGTYPYKPGATRATSFVIPDDVKVYGGFDKSEDFLYQRAGLYEQTILTGDFNQTPTDPTDDAYHVVSLLGISQGIVLDGFKIQHGNANGTGLDQNYGGGLWVNRTSNLEVANCTFTECLAQFGGGANIALVDGMTMKWCTFEDNIATHSSGNAQGGGLLIGDPDSTHVYDVEIYNTVFRYNVADDLGGGLAVTQSDTPPVLQNCLFHDNQARLGGGLWLDVCADLRASGCTFALNQVSGVNASGGGIFVGLGGDSCGGGINLRLRNSIVWGNTSTGTNRSIGPQQLTWFSITYSDIQDGWTGTGNIDQDPLFTDANTRVFTLKSASPCVETGSNAKVFKDLADVDDDFDTNETTPWDIRHLIPRIAGPVGTPPGSAIVDMGCYERAVGYGE